MATWNDNAITDVGLELLEQSLASGKVLTLSRASVGSGYVESAALKDQIELSAPLSDVTVLIAEQLTLDGGSGLQLKLQIRNDGISAAYTFNQVGIYATDGVTEVLFAIYQDTNGEEIPATTDYPDFMEIFTAVIALSQTYNVTVSISSSAYITKADFAAGIGKIAGGGDLLDNSDFHVNQRGQSSYTTAGFTVDRWNINIGKVEIAENGIVITNDGAGIMRLRQNTEFGYAQIAGKPLSISVRADGTTYSATADVPAEKPTAAFTELVGIEISDGISFVCNYSLANDTIFAYFGLSEGTSLAPEWVKLEVGTVTPFVPPHPADALARCQRYYQIRSTNDIAAVDLRPTMRTLPTDIVAVEGGYAYVAEF